MAKPKATGSIKKRNPTAPSNAEMKKAGKHLPKKAKAKPSQKAKSPKLKGTKKPSIKLKK